MKFTSHDFSQEFFPHKFPVFSTITKYKIMSHALKLKFTFHEIHIFSCASALFLVNFM